MSSQSEDSNEGCAWVVGFLLVSMVVGGLMAIPKGVWLGIGATVAVACAAWVGLQIFRGVVHWKLTRAVQLEKLRATAAHDEQEAWEESLGHDNARLVDTARNAVVEITTSRAAREG